MQYTNSKLNKIIDSVLSQSTWIDAKYTIKDAGKKLIVYISGDVEFNFSLSKEFVEEATEEYIAILILKNVKRFYQQHYL